jgi:hypothetical protein
LAKIHRVKKNNLSEDGPFDAFGYDAVFAIAHALHDLNQVQAKMWIVGDELLEHIVLTGTHFEAERHR